MDLTAYFTLLVLAAMAVALMMEMAGTGVILFLTLSVFVITGIVTPQQALAGFSSPALVTIGLLFIVAAGVQNTGALDSVVFYFLGKRRRSGIPTSIFKMAVPVSCLSAFLNNTPIVMIFTPIIKKWAEWLDYAPSKFLIPLSYATMFGGMCTLIGTSTNLVVHGMMVEKGMDGYTMFELAKIGIPCTLIGWFYLAFVGQKLLPSRKSLTEMVGENVKEYVIEMKVSRGCELVGKTIQDAGLRNLKNMYLLEIERDGETIGPVAPEERIKEDDRLMFVGVTSAIVDLQEIKGLVPAAHEMFETDFSRMSVDFAEAVISQSSPLLGKTVKEADFRKRYDAGVIAIHRNGERIKDKIGSIRLRPGDTLLLLATRGFLRNWYNSSDFFLVSKIKEQERKNYNKAYVAVGILAVMVLSVAFKNMLPSIGGQKISMLYAAFAAAALMLVTGCVNTEQAKKAIKPNVLLTILCALGISKALVNSGIAGLVADRIVNMSATTQAMGILAILYVSTGLLAAAVNNITAVTLVFPIALLISMRLGVDPKPLFIAITVSAATTFATPIGYQTNLIVQGAGSYRFRDYVKVGIPLNVLFLVLSVILIPIFWKF